MYGPWKLRPRLIACPSNIASPCHQVPQWPGESYCLHTAQRVNWQTNPFLYHLRVTAGRGKSTVEVALHWSVHGWQYRWRCCQEHFLVWVWVWEHFYARSLIVKHGSLVLLTGTKIWSWEVKVALLEEVRQHQHQWNPQDKFYKKQTLQRTTFERVAATLLEIFISWQDIDKNR